jgi:hypothetical protein
MGAVYLKYPLWKDSRRLHNQPQAAQEDSSVFCCATVVDNSVSFVIL